MSPLTGPTQQIRPILIFIKYVARRITLHLSVGANSTCFPTWWYPLSISALTLEIFSHDIEWIADTRASIHLIDKPGMLENLCNYFGTNVVIIGDNNSHAITHVGDTYIDYDTTRIKLWDVLLVPALKKNILSIRQPTNNDPYNCEFYCVDYVVKEWEANRVLMTGQWKSNLYTLSPLQSSLLHPFPDCLWRSVAPTFEASSGICSPSPEIQMTYSSYLLQ